MNGRDTELSELAHVALGCIGGLLPFLLSVANARGTLPAMGAETIPQVVIQVALGGLASWLMPTNVRLIAVYHGATAPALLAVLIKHAN